MSALKTSVKQFLFGGLQGNGQTASLSKTQSRANPINVKTTKKLRMNPVKPLGKGKKLPKSKSKKGFPGKTGLSSTKKG